VSSSESDNESADTDSSLMTNLFCLGVETETATASDRGDDVDKPAEEIEKYLKKKTWEKSSRMRA